MIAIDLLYGALISLLCGLDRTAALQIMISRPIVAAPLAAWVLGEPLVGLQIGMMVEVPAAAIALELFLEDVDFVSIGSNDLVQYLTAADRDNPKVNHLCQALSPAVIRVLHSIVATCGRAGKSVTLCGEMAGSPRAFILLVGLGLRSFSMSPAFISSIFDVATG